MYVCARNLSAYATVRVCVCVCVCARVCDYVTRAVVHHALVITVFSPLQVSPLLRSPPSPPQSNSCTVGLDYGGITISLLLFNSLRARDTCPLATI